MWSSGAGPHRTVAYVAWGTLVKGAKSVMISSALNDYGGCPVMNYGNCTRGKRTFRETRLEAKSPG